MSDAQELADRYVEIWNQPDSERRQLLIRNLWAADGVHFVGTREAIGYEALQERVTGSHEKNVRGKGYRFRAVQNAMALRDVVTFRWEMIEAATDRVAATGLEFLVLNQEHKVRTDYQFIVG
jgi:hypothetical protein